MYPPVKIPLTGSNKIERGASWGPLIIFFPGNFVLWNLLGQIRILETDILRVVNEQFVDNNLLIQLLNQNIFKISVVFN
jgi:hypothetical protein